MKNIIICDIDGTVADLSHRLHYIKDGNHDWDSFHASVDKDAPRQEIIDLLHELLSNGNYSLYFVSGRNESSREKTEAWITQYIGDFHQALYMRPEKDYRDDRIIKKEILDAHFKKEDIFMVIDDRPKVVAMWKSEGLNVLDVGPGQDNPF